ncbi:MAG: hypothetical protein H3C41_06870 [Bacteroidales bacterium]|nr:hypothetical protein [Bacteroidales bacterium]
MQPKMHQKDLTQNDEFVKRPGKKVNVKRDRKLSIYDRMDEDDDNLEFDLYGYEEEGFEEGDGDEF